MKGDKRDLDVFVDMGERNRLDSLGQEALPDLAINIILDESAPQSPVFVEIEDDKGRSIRIGTRMDIAGGLTRLRITVPEIISST